MVFADPQYADNLTNLNEFLAEWGISYSGGVTIRDTENAMSTDGYSIIAQYQSDTLGGVVNYELPVIKCQCCCHSWSIIVSECVP